MRASVVGARSAQWPIVSQLAGLSDGSSPSRKGLSGAQQSAAPSPVGNNNPSVTTTILSIRALMLHWPSNCRTRALIVFAAHQVLGEFDRDGGVAAVGVGADGFGEVLV
jgi:hypothetical protein